MPNITPIMPSDLAYFVGTDAAIYMKEFFNHLSEIKGSITYTEMLGLCSYRSPTDLDGKDAYKPAWFGIGAYPQEYKDERVPQPIADYKFEVDITKYEQTHAWKKEVFEDNKGGEVKEAILDFAPNHRQWVREKVQTLLNVGNATVCYDGQNFFANAHTEGASGSQDNLLSTALSAANLGTARTAMMAFKDDKGKVMGITPDTLVVSADLADTALMILNGAYYYDDANLRFNISATYNLKLVVGEFLTADTWYLLATQYRAKPLLFLERIALEYACTLGTQGKVIGGTDISSLGYTAMDSNAFMTDGFAAGTRCRMGFGYFQWRFAIKGK